MLNYQRVSMDWKGKITGMPHSELTNLWFPVDVLWNQVDNSYGQNILESMFSMNSLVTNQLSRGLETNLGVIIYTYDIIANFTFRFTWSYLLTCIHVYIYIYTYNLMYNYEWISQQTTVTSLFSGLSWWILLANNSEFQLVNEHSGYRTSL